MFAILAIVTGCNSYRGVVIFIDVHRRRLNAAFGLNCRRAPAHTAVRYILQGLDPAGVEAAFRRHECRPGAERVRHRLRAGARPHRRCREVQRDPGRADASGRTRRRPRHRRHARRAALPKKHLAIPAAANTALIVGVKDNQPTLHPRVQEVSAITAPLGTAHSHDKSRNRDERRTVTVLEPNGMLADTDWHPHVAAIVRVERLTFTRNAKTGLLRHSNETASYVSNTPVTAIRAAEAIRAHWKVENTSHYSRDVTLGEDRSRIRTNPGVFARLRSVAFNILKANQTNTLSQDRYSASLAGIGKLLRMLAVS